jgi:hypothetical protein
MVVWSLAAALNIAWSIAGQEAVTASRGRIKDRRFQRAVVRASSERLADAGVPFRTARALLRDPTFRRMVVDCAESDSAPGANLKRRTQRRLDKLAFLDPVRVANALVAGFVEVVVAQAAVIDQLTYAKVGAVEDLVRSATPDCEEAAVELAERSALTAEDANLVCTLVNDAKEPSPVYLSDGLYVRRSIDASVAALAQVQPLIVVTGEPGVGKTSLLWSLHRQMAEQRAHVWFLRANSLVDVANPGLEMSAARFLRTALACAARRGEEPFVLLDTVDVLLHDDAGREQILSLLSAVSRAGGHVVATSRPLEATQLPATNQIDLGGYSDADVRAAILLHHGRFAVVAGPGEEPDVDGLLTAVRWGLPLKPILVKPLTLRMLFEVYAPDALPVDITTFDLYSKFWETRVLKDARAGSPNPIDGEDLSAAATALAVGLLSEGTTAMAAEGTASDLIPWLPAPRAAAALIRRGVLRSEGGPLGFFHQTFFEHAAARGLTRMAGAEGLARLIERAESRPSDAYLWPVVEQALLVASASPSNDADVAVHLCRWIEGSDELPFRVALSVFSQWPRPMGRVLDLVEGSLAGEDAARGRSFVQATQQMTAGRAPEISSLLDSAWQRDRWSLRVAVVERLPRLAMIDPDALMGLERRHALTRMVTGHPEGPTTTQPLFAALVACGSDHVVAAADVVRRAFSHLDSSARATTILEQVAHAVAERPEAAAGWLPLLEGLAQDPKVRRPVSLLEALSEVAAAASSQQDMSLSSMVDARGLSDVVGLVRRRAAIRRLAGGEADLMALATFMTSAAAAELRQNTDRLAELATRDPAARAVIEDVWDDLIRAPQDGRAAAVARALAGLPPDELLELIDRSGRGDDPVAWTDARLLRPLLVEAAIAGLASADRALRQLAFGDAARQVRIGLAARLEHAVAEAPRLSDAFVEAALSVGQPQKVLRALDRLSARSAHTDELVTALRSWLRSAETSADEGVRLRGLRLMRELSRSPDHAWMLHDFRSPLESIEAVKEPLALQHLLAIGRHNVESGIEGDIDRCIEVSRPLARHAHEGVRNEAKLLHVAALCRSDAESAWSDAWRVVLEAPLWTRHVIMLAEAAAREVERDPTLAAHRLAEVAEMASSNLADHPTRDFASNLRRHLARVVPRLDDDASVTLTKRLAHLADPIASAAVAVAFSPSGPGSIDWVDQLLADPLTSARTRSVIGAHQERAHRRLGSSHWPWLSDLVTSAAPG